MIGLNGTIARGSGFTTVDWREKMFTSTGYVVIFGGQEMLVRHKHVVFAFVPRQCVGEKPVYMHAYGLSTNFEGG